MFVPGLLRELRRRPGSLVMFSDRPLGHWLSRLRSVAPCRLLLRNGGPDPPPFDHVDHVQQISPEGMRAARDAGEPLSKHTLLPTALLIARTLSLPTNDERTELRKRLGMPAARQVVVSVAALNASHKRLDVLVRAVAGCVPRPYLVMLGQRNWETPALEELACRQLGQDGFSTATVGHDEVSDYLRAADLYVLPSLREGLGRATIEAAAAGLPCILHDYEVARYVLGEYGHYGRLEQDTVLREMVDRQLRGPDWREGAAARHHAVYERFSWDALRPEYVSLLRRVGGMST